MFLATSVIQRPWNLCCAWWRKHKRCWLLHVGLPRVGHLLYPLIETRRCFFKLFFGQDGANALQHPTYSAFATIHRSFLRLPKNQKNRQTILHPLKTRLNFCWKTNLRWEAQTDPVLSEWMECPQGSCSNPAPSLTCLEESRRYVDWRLGRRG